MVFVVYKLDSCSFGRGPATTGVVLLTEELWEVLKLDIVICLEVSRQRKLENLGKCSSLRVNLKNIYEVNVCRALDFVVTFAFLLLVLYFKNDFIFICFS